MLQDDIRGLLKNLNFWLILLSTILITMLYLVWPWQSWIIENSIWRYFPWLSALKPLAIWEILNEIFGIMFIIPNVYAFAAIRSKDLISTIFIIIIGFIPMILCAYFGYFPQLIFTLIFPLFTIIFVSVRLSISLRKKDNEFMQNREKERRLYTIKIIDAQESERKRISQELHDETIQTFLAISNYAKALQSSNDPSSVKISKIIQQASLKSAKELRRMLLNLRPQVLDDLGLKSALSWLIDYMNREKGINFKININGMERKFDLKVELTIFRIVQEALNNAKQHSNGSEATVYLEYLPDGLEITIEDNGDGFSPFILGELIKQGKMGLIGMRERVYSLSGKFQVISNPGIGTKIYVFIKY